MSRWTVCFLCLVLLACAAGARGEPLRLRLLHVNDFHGRAAPEPDPGTGTLLGGLPQLAARVRTLRAEGPCLLLAAGDMIQGAPWANLSRGASVVEAMNALGFDAMVLGNHEFDFGQAVLKSRIEAARFPVLAANAGGVPGVKPYAVLTAGGVRVGVIGVVTEQTPSQTHPDNTKGIEFRSAARAVAGCLERLRGKADVFVVLSHLGYAADRRLAEQVRGIHVIVGGHSHTKLDRPALVGKTLIVQAWEHGKALGVVDLTVEGGRLVGSEGRLEEISPGLSERDPQLEALVRRYADIADVALNEPLCSLTEDLVGERARERETSLGDLVADVVRRSSGADVALINGGGIRAGVRKGPVRLKDLYAALPFENYVVVLELTGRQLLQALEHGVSWVAEGQGGFPQVSGLRFTWSPARESGRRVRAVFVGDEPLEPDRRYRVATHDFLAAGGDGYRIFLEARPGRTPPGRRVRDLVAEFLRRAETCAPPPTGRILEEDPG